MDLQAHGGGSVDGAPQRSLEFVKARLTRNCRNTRSIAEHTAMIAGFETPPFKPGAEVGIDVDYRYWGPSRTWQDLLTETVEDLTKKGSVPAVDITVLTPGRAEREALRKVERLGGHPLIDCASNLGVDRSGIKITTIHAFKGMESSVVVIPGIDRKLEEWDPALLYVGMSRARSLLILIVHEKARDAVVRRIKTVRQGSKEQAPN